MAKTNPNGKTVVSDNRLRIMAAEHCRIGDRVMMAVRSNDDGWTPRAVKNGVEGVVIGFNRYTFFNGRLSHKPGKWAGNGSPIVAWDNGVDAVAAPQDMVFVDKSLQARKDVGWAEAFKRHQFISPLPDTPFYEEDVCTINKGIMVKIAVIDYDDLNSTGEGACYTVRYLETPSTTSQFRADELTLHSRGTVWIWYNDRAAFDKLSLETRIEAHVRMKFYDEVRNPRTGRFDWTDADIAAAATEGKIDTVRRNGYTQALRLHDRALGEAALQVLREAHLRA